MSSTEPGQSRKVQLSPRYLAVAVLTSVDICRARASGVASPTMLASLTEPRRLVTPQAKRMASSSVVLPERYGPTSAAQRGAIGCLPLSVTSASPHALLDAARGSSRELPGGASLSPMVARAAAMRNGNFAAHRRSQRQETGIMLSFPTSSQAGTDRIASV